MLFAEEPQKWAGWTIDILGTDVSTACIDRARAGIYSQFEVQRGLGINQMIKMVRGMRRRLARGRAAAQARALPGPQSAGAAAASGRVRHRPVPQRDALSQPGEEGAGVRAHRRRHGRGWLADAGRGRNGDRPDQQARRRHQRPRPVPPDRRRQPRSRNVAVPTAEPPPGLDPNGRARAPLRHMDWTSSIGHRPISTSARCRSR